MALGHLPAEFPGAVRPLLYGGVLHLLRPQGKKSSLCAFGGGGYVTWGGVVLGRLESRLQFRAAFMSLYVLRGFESDTTLYNLENCQNFLYIRFLKVLRSIESTTTVLKQHYIILYEH